MLVSADLLQEKMRKRTANYLYWFNQASIVPWIVGETGFTASASHSISEGLNGTLADQGKFVEYTLDAVCNCGGSGFSWWQYQDVWWTTPDECYLGLLERATLPQPSAEKQPAVNHFRNYPKFPTANPSACPVDRTDIFDANKLYYNPFGYPRNSQKEITRRVIDQDGKPIKNAVVRVWVDMGAVVPPIPNPTPDNPNNKITYFPDTFWTFTDADGYFTAIPTQYNSLSDTIPLPTEWPGIAMIWVSAAGAEVQKPEDWGWWWCAGCLESHIPNPIVLNKIKDDVVVSELTVTSGQTKTYKGRKSLTVSNTTINSGGNATFTSAKSITLLPGFNAQAGSVVNIYIAPYDCNELDIINAKSIFLASKNNLPEIDGIADNKTIQLSFAHDFVENTISIFPNPANYTVTIQLNSNNNESFFNYIRLYDVFGRTVLHSSISENFYVFDISKLPKGIFFIEASDFNSKYYQKLIIQ